MRQLMLAVCVLGAAALGACGNTIHLECTFDNLQADEPIINGAQMTSRPLRWGEKTTDEMCLNYLTSR